MPVNDVAPDFGVTGVVQTIERGSTGVRIGTATGSTEQTKGVDDTIEADGVVVCAGVASRKLAHALGDRLNVYPVKGYSITIDLLSDASQRAAPRGQSTR